MTDQEPIIVLSAGAAHFGGFWRLPETDVASLYSFRTSAAIAQRAEAAAIHAIFDADSLGVRRDQVATSAPRGFEPVSWYGALAAVTRRIGLIATISTTYSHPYNVARQLASLDRISGGRIGWNVVTSALDVAARNFGEEHLPEHDLRYERAAEFVEVVQRLLTSFDADALVADKEAGVVFDPERVHETHHSGRFFSIAGPLNVPASPQGWPVINQAGASPAGRELAARYAETVYANVQDIEDAIEYRNDLRARAASHGRDPDSIKVLVGIRLVTAPSEDEALEHLDRVTALATRDRSLSRISELIGFDLDTASPRDPIPELPAPETSNNYQGQLRLLSRIVERENLVTVGELTTRLRRSWGHLVVAGDPAGNADVLEEWTARGAVDGFVVGGDLTGPHGLEGTIDLVVPELQRRGSYRRETTAGTFREDLGLPAPTR